MKTIIKEFVLKHPVVTLGGVYICAKTVKKCVYAITGYKGSKDSLFSFNFNLNVPESVAEAIKEKSKEKSEDETQEEEPVESDGEDDTVSSNITSSDVESLMTMFEQWKKNGTVISPATLGGNDV